MRNPPWPATYRIDPSMVNDEVIRVIKGMRWDPQEWQALRVAANLADERSETTIPNGGST